MSYGVYKHIIHREKIGSAETKATIELLKKDYVGSVGELYMTGDFFSHEYENISPKKPFDKPLQKSTLQADILVQGSSELSILEEIFNADESEFRLRKKVNDSVIWTGTVLNDLLEYSEGPYPFTGSIVAKDLSSLAGPKYNLTDGEETLISVISGILATLDLGLNIKTYTSWTNALLADDDYLNQIEIDTHNIREYGRPGESDQRVTLLRALEEVLRGNNLILRQARNAWRLYHLSALKNSSNVRVFTYDSGGVQLSDASEDITIEADRIARYVLPASMNRFNKALNEVSVSFDHRTTVSGININERIEIEGDDTESFSQFFQSDGNQQIGLSSGVRAFISPGASQSRVVIQIRAGDYYWDGESWVPSFTTIQIPLTNSGLVMEGYDIWIGSINIETTHIPVDADGSLGIILDSANSADRTIYHGIGFSLENPSVEDGNNTSIDYELTRQSGVYSPNHESGKIWFGDGPTSYARSAYRFGGTFTASNWRFRGESDGWDFFQLHSKEILGNQRNPTQNLNALLLGEYEPDKTLAYRSSDLFFLGGVQTGRGNTWDAHFLKLDFEDAADDFNIIYKTGESEGGASTGGGGSTGGTGWNDIAGKPSTEAAWASETSFDSRYLQIANDLSEVDAEQARGNLNLGNIATLDLSSTFTDTGGTLNLKFNETNLKLDGNGALNTIQPIATSSTPDFQQVTVNNQASQSSHVLRGSTAISAGTGVTLSETLLRNSPQISTLPATLTQAGHVTTGSQSFAGEKTFSDNILFSGQSYLSSIDFTQGFSGSGGRFGYFDGSWKAEVDDMYVRGAAFFNELIINQISAVNGSDIVSPGRGKIEEVQPGSDIIASESSIIASESSIIPSAVYTVSDPQGNDIASFAQDDIVIVQQVQPDAFDGGQLVKRVVRQVGNVKDNTFGLGGLLADDAPSDVGEIEVGDIIVALGNSTNEDRQATIYRSVIDSGAPSVRVNEGVASWTDWISASKAVIQYGNISGLPFVQGDEKGFWARDNFYVSFDDGQMKFGRNADGEGNPGIYFDEDNYWLLNRGLNIQMSSVSGLTSELEGISSSITANSEEINLRVETANVINSINISEEEVVIEGNKLRITSATEFTSSVQIRGHLDGVDGTFSGILDAVTGTFGEVEISAAMTMTSGVINLPPTFSSQTGQIDNSGIQLVYEDGDSQAIQWLLFGQNPGRIRPISGGILELSSDFGVNLEGGSGDVNLNTLEDINLNAGTLGGGAINLNADTVLSNRLSVNGLRTSNYDTEQMSDPGNYHLPSYHDLLVLGSLTVSGTYIYEITRGAEDEPFNGQRLTILNSSTNDVYIDTTVSGSNIRLQTGNSTRVIFQWSTCELVYYGSYWYVEQDFGT